MSDVGSLWTLQTFLTNLVASAFFAAEFFIWRLHFQLWCVCIGAYWRFGLLPHNKCHKWFLNNPAQARLVFAYQFFIFIKTRNKKNLGYTIVSEKCEFFIILQIWICFLFIFIFLVFWLFFFFVCFVALTHLCGLGYLWQIFTTPWKLLV